MPDTTRKVRFVSRFGTVVGIAVIAVGIAHGGIGERGAAAWAGSRAVTADAGCSAGSSDPPGNTPGTATSRFGGGGGTLAHRH